MISATQHWLKTLVIDLSLCPFAERVIRGQELRFHCCDATTESELLETLASELSLLERDGSIETTLLIHPHVLEEFQAYNQFLSRADSMLRKLGKEGVYQIASFHPDYQFAGTNQDDAENYTNRSPFPMLHILREESVEKAIATYPDIDNVPTRNISRMNDMGAARLRALLDACRQ